MSSPDHLLLYNYKSPLDEIRQSVLGLCSFCGSNPFKIGHGGPSEFVFCFENFPLCIVPLDLNEPRLEALGHGIDIRCVVRDGIFFFSHLRSRARSLGSEICQIWPHARSIGSDGVNRSEWRFRYYEFTGLSPGRHGAGIFDFVAGARSRDTELGLFGQINPSSWTWNDQC